MLAFYCHIWLDFKYMYLNYIKIIYLFLTSMYLINKYNTTTIYPSIYHRL